MSIVREGRRKIKIHIQIKAILVIYINLKFVTLPRRVEIRKSRKEKPKKREKKSNKTLRTYNRIVVCACIYEKIHCK